jgi:hypothetical protein
MALGVVVFFLLASPTSFAQWSSDPSINLAICDTSGSQELPKIAATSDGGCYVSWFDTRGSGYKVYMQRLNAQGVKQWATNGLLISAHPQNTSLVDYDLDVDDSNYAVVVFTDIRNGGQIEPFAYRISPQGNFVWGTDGVALSTSPSTFQANPRVVSTSDGSYVFSWIFSSTPNKVALQKLNVAGAKQWGVDPILLLGTGTENLTYPSLVRSDAGSVILLMSGYSGSFLNPQNYRLYTQKFSPAGAPLWGSVPDTVYALGRVSGFFVPKLIPDGNNGAFYVWHDDRNNTGSSFSHVQHITSTDVKLFPVNGSAGSTLPGRLHNDAWVAYTPLTGETYMFWYETDAQFQSSYGVYGQKFSTNGTRQWPDSGKAFRPFGGGQPSFIRCSAKDSAAVVFYFDGVTVTNNLVKGFKIDRNGNFLWSGSIINVSSVASSKGRLGGAFTADGTSLLVWSDNRVDGNGVYGQNVKFDGTLGAQTRIPAGNVSGTWTRAASPYFIDGEISLLMGSTLTIEPGVQVLFTGHYKFNVYGRLLAVGTAADTIVFTAQNTTAGWHGLRFYNTNSNAQDSSKLVYCRLEYGKAVSTVSADKEGGAMRLENSSNVLINRCWFRYNYADYDGGAVIARGGSNVSIDNSLFTANYAYFYGGGFMCRASSPVIRNSVFMNDTNFVFGAGISGWDNSIVRVENVKILNCRAGAAAGIYTANNTTITIVNSLIAGNTAITGFGGGAGFSVSNATLINVTMINNSSPQGGGAAWFYQSTSSVKNSIFWTNQPDAFSVNAGTFQCTYSDISGGWTGTGNINVNPAFVGSGDHPFALQDTSRCRDAGNPDTTGLGLPLLDLAGNPRVAGGRIDMGAYEVQNAQPVPGWTMQTSGITNQFYSVKAVNATTAWAAAVGGRVLRTVNGGSTWTSVGGGRIGTADVYNITAVDGNTAFVTTTPSTTTYIFRTTNGGAVWDTVFQQAGGFIDAMHMYDANNGIAIGDPVAGRYTFLRTTNGGTTWVRTATEPTPGTGEASSQNDLAVFGTNYIWIGASANGRIYRSTDAGATWASSTVPGAVAATNVIAVWFNSAQYGIASAVNGSTYTAYRSTDGGVTWTAVTVGTAGYNIAVGGSGNDDFWMARGTDVYRSTNRAATWTLSYTGTGTFYDLDFCTSGSSTYGWGVKDNGNIVMYFGTISGVEEKAPEIPTTFALEQNYPNPFNPTTTLRYALPKDAWVTLSIYNILGQQIAILKDEVQNVGNHSVVWDGRNDFSVQVSSGVYFYRIEARPVGGSEDFKSIKKMLLLK